MMHDTQLPAAQLPLDELISQAQTFLGRQYYTRNHAALIRHVWREFLSYAASLAQAGPLCTDLVRQFIWQRYACAPGDKLSDRQRVAQRAMRMLVDYALHGHWERGGHGGAFLALTPENQRLLDAFAADTDRRGFSIRTVRPCLIRLRQFLLYLQGRELLLKQVNSKIISDFVATQLQFRQRTVEMITYCLRMFFSFLHQHGELPTDLSGDVPRVRVVKDQRIPSVWKREDVERLLAAVDRGNPTGKRDYAILLLVLRLGLRVGDIRELRLEHFLWEAKQLVFTQAKTGQAITLPLQDEVGWAVIDYLRSGRPRTEARQVFVRHVAPFGPFGPNNNLYGLINTYRIKAGIAMAVEQRHGLHSLRHTLASSLLEQHIALPTITAIMGHLDSGSTQIYLKVDLAQLRQCALESGEATDATA